MTEGPHGPENRPGRDDTERRLTELGRTAGDPIDPRFADRLESSLRAMHAEPRPVYRRYLVRPAVLLVAAVLIIAGVATLALRDGDPDPLRQVDDTIVARPSPTTAPSTPEPEPTPSATPQSDPTPDVTPPPAEPTAVATLPDAPAPTPTPEPVVEPTTAPTASAAPSATPAGPPAASRPTPTPAASPSPTAAQTPTAAPTPTMPPAPTPRITMAIQDRRLRSVTLAWSIDDPSGIADLVVIAAAPGGRRYAELPATERSLVVPRPADGPIVVVVAARDADGGELARSNRVVIAARR